MSALRRRALSLVLLLIAGQSAIAGPCDAHFSFDGNLADSGGNGYDGQMVDNQGRSAQAQFVEGRSGQALQLNGVSVMRALMNLHPDNCPQLTITAWIKVAPDAGEGYIVSSEGQEGPGFRYFGRSISMLGPDYGITKREVLYPDTWMFVALVYDAEHSMQTLHVGASGSSGREIGDRIFFPGPALWVGAYGPNVNYAPQGVAIDELRIIGSALGHEQLANLQTSPTGTATGTGGSPLFIQEMPDSEIALGDRNAPALEYESEEAAIIAQLERDLAAERQRNAELERELEELRGQLDQASGSSGGSSGSGGAGGNQAGPVGEPVYTSVLGVSTNDIKSIDLNDRFLNRIKLSHDDDRMPCSISVGTGVSGQYSNDDVWETGRCATGGSSGYIWVALSDSVISRLEICSGPDDEVAGLRVWGQHVAEDGSQSYRPSASTNQMSECNDNWLPQSVLCPGDTVGTGVVAHAKSSSGKGVYVTGLQLICRRVGIQ